MGHTLETVYSDRLSRFPYTVRVPVPRVGVTRALDAMHHWASTTAPQYAASPFRDYSDPWNPQGAFTWHFGSAESARQFAARFSGKIVTRR